MENGTRLQRALELLWAERGRPARCDDDDLLGVLIRMILGQATSKQNASQAFGQLLDEFAGEWSRVVAAPVDQLVEAIAVGGLANQKAPRIQKLLREVHEEFGDYTLAPVREMNAEDALTYVTRFDGVGPTTARFTLMAAAGLDVFPINGGIRRTLERVGVLDASWSDTKRHRKAQEMLPEGAAYAAHMTLVRHARTTCHSRAPECDSCPARPVCLFGSLA